MTGVVLVTGGTFGIGEATVRRLSRDGWRVIFCGRDQLAGREVQLAAAGSRFVPCDLARPEDVDGLIQSVRNEAVAGLAGLVNNAGISCRRPFGSTGDDDVDRLLTVNLRSLIALTRGLLPDLVRARGSVVSVSSIAGMRGHGGLALYSATKAATANLMQSLAVEYGQRIRCNAVCPGEIWTRMTEDEEAVVRQIEARVPARRFGRPDEVAAVIAWLLSDESSYVNGAVIPVDGGESAGFARLPGRDASERV